MGTPVNVFNQQRISETRLWSLWDMLQTHAAVVVKFTNHLNALHVTLERRNEHTRTEMKKQGKNTVADWETGLQLADYDRKELSEALGPVQTWAEEHDLKGTLDQLELFNEIIANPKAWRSAAIEKITALLKTIEKELGRLVFLYMPEDDSKLYKNPLGMFPTAPSKFPSAVEGMSQAVLCYACNRYDGCVFHCMGVLQVGLYALARELKVTNVDIGFPMELAEWCRIIDQIEAKVKDMRQLPKGTVKDDLLKFYSDCGMQFRYFKDAWRNHVCHFRESSDRDQAHSVLIHTRDFMEKLAERIAEQPLPPVRIDGQTLNP